MSDLKDMHVNEKLTLCPGNMQTSDDLIDWVLTVLSSNHLTEEDLKKWWSEEIQFAVPHKEEK